MRQQMLAAWQEDDGVMSFEWVLLVSLLVIGVVTGVAAARDAVIDELGDVGQAMLAVDQSYSVDFPLSIAVHDGNSSATSDSQFSDALLYADCSRGAGAPPQGLLGQGALFDNG